MPQSRRRRIPVPASSKPPVGAYPRSHANNSNVTPADNSDASTLLTPVRDKFREGKNNLQGRANAFKRRRRTTR